MAGPDAALRVGVEAVDRAFREAEEEFRRQSEEGTAAGAARAQAKARDEPLSLAAAFGMECEEREQVAVWVSEELDLAREELFAAAVQIHLTFLGGARGQVVDNLRLFVDAQRGDREVALERPQIGRHLWNTFFMTVPGISSTFASVGRMFGDDFGPGELGWLLIDEAGQVPPQAAVGALWRARRAVVVGDPKQVEPVVTISNQVSALVYRQHKVPNVAFNVRVGSVQTVSDRRNPLGAYIDEVAAKAWAKTHVGAVHSFQGKEAETVLRLLGGSAARPGAVAWDAKTPNILNVAATRANSFLYVVGDLGLGGGGGFREAAERLEIVPVPNFVALAPDPESVERVDTLNGHLRLLAEAFGRARCRVAISSPYLTDRAIQDDQCNVLASMPSCSPSRPRETCRTMLPGRSLPTPWLTPSSNGGGDRNIKTDRARSATCRIPLSAP